MATTRIFGHYLRVQYLLLALFEFLISVGCVYAGAAVRFGGSLEKAEAMGGSLLPGAIFFGLAMVPSMVALGLYQSNLRDGILGIVLRVGLAAGLGWIAAAVAVIHPPLYLGRGTLTVATTAEFLSISLVRLASFSSKVQHLFKRRVLVLGTGRKAAALLEMRRRSDWQGFALVGFVHLASNPELVPSEKVINLEDTLVAFAKRREIDQIVVAIDERRKHIPVEQLMECKTHGIDVVDVITFFEREFGKIPIDILDPSHFIFSDGFHINRFHEYTKRCFDLVASLLLLGIGWPIMVMIAIAILLESQGKGPVFYRQTRVSKDGKKFEMLKIRSMKIDAEQGQPRWADENDTRITQVGRFIRKYRLDELPQSINILRGDMSFVGPRPERPEFVTELSQKIPFYTTRHLVKAGISGWAQLCYPYGASENDAKEKLQYDLYYVKNGSVFLDLVILFRTAEVVLFKKGAR